MPRYQVHLTAPPEDGGALSRAASELGDERVVLVADEEERQPPSEEFVGTGTVIAMDIEEVTTKTVVVTAKAIYERIHKHAGLPPGTGNEPVTMVPTSRLLMFDPKSGEFFQIAERLYDEENYLYTIVAAQTAFELYMEGMFDYVLHLRTTVDIGEAIGEMIRDYNLDNQRVRRLWRGFTGHSLTDNEKVWRAYKAHLERRHGLVHRGERVTQAEAAESLKAVNDLATQIADVVIRLMPRPGPPPPSEEQLGAAIRMALGPMYRGGPATHEAGGTPGAGTNDSACERRTPDGVAARRRYELSFRGGSLSREGGSSASWEPSASLRASTWKFAGGSKRWGGLSGSTRATTNEGSSGSFASPVMNSRVEVN